MDCYLYFLPKVSCITIYKCGLLGRVGVLVNGFKEGVVQWNQDSARGSSNRLGGIAVVLHH